MAKGGGTLAWPCKIINTMYYPCENNNDDMALFLCIPKKWNKSQAKEFIELDPPHQHELE